MTLRDTFRDTVTLDHLLSELADLETALVFEVDAGRLMRLALAIQSRRLQLEAEGLS